MLEEEGFGDVDADTDVAESQDAMADINIRDDKTIPYDVLKRLQKNGTDSLYLWRPTEGLKVMVFVPQDSTYYRGICQTTGTKETARYKIKLLDQMLTSHEDANPLPRGAADTDFYVEVSRKDGLITFNQMVPDLRQDRQPSASDASAIKEGGLMWSLTVAVGRPMGAMARVVSVDRSQNTFKWAFALDRFAQEFSEAIDTVLKTDYFVTAPDIIDNGPDLFHPTVHAEAILLGTPTRAEIKVATETGFAAVAPEAMVEGKAQISVPLVDASYTYGHAAAAAAATNVYGHATTATTAVAMPAVAVAVPAVAVAAPATTTIAPFPVATTTEPRKLTQLEKLKQKLGMI